MKQTFDVRGGPADGRAHLPLLRAALIQQGLDGIYIPHEDEYQNEYLPAANERLAWATGFTGSAGSALIFAERAVLFTDGRYTLQAADQVDRALIDIVDMPDPGPFGWLAGQDLAGQVIGYDPKLMSPNDLAKFKAAATRAGADLHAVSSNPVDMAWKDRPAQPAAKILPHDLTYAGQASADKRHAIAKVLGAAGADAAVITAPASIAWLFNIRGGDVACTPLPLGRAIIHADGTAAVYTDPAKVDDALRAHLGNAVTVHAFTALEEGLQSLSGQSVSLDPDTASAWFFTTLEAAGAHILQADDPCALPKACKNAAELKGTAAAHRRDGAVLVQFLHWLETQAQSGTVTEIDAVTRLERFRDATGKLKDLSFESISGAGPNGAIVHYRVSTATNRVLERGSLFS